MKLINKILILIAVSVTVSACHSNKKVTNWPENLPERSIFVKAYEKQVKAGNNESSLNVHLKWIKRFYRGLSIYPGWNDMTKIVLDSMSDLPIKQQRDAEQRLAQLGEKIAIEWAQSNDSRNIDSANINVWGNALRTSVKREQQFSFISLVEKDVDQLIARKLDMRAIKPERYYPAEDFDDF